MRILLHAQDRKDLVLPLCGNLKVRVRVIPTPRPCSCIGTPSSGIARPFPGTASPAARWRCPPRPRSHGFPSPGGYAKNRQARAWLKPASLSNRTMRATQRHQFLQAKSRRWKGAVSNRCGFVWMGSMPPRCKVPKGLLRGGCGRFPRSWIVRTGQQAPPDSPRIGKCCPQARSPRSDAGNRHNHNTHQKDDQQPRAHRAVFTGRLDEFVVHVLGSG